MYSAVKLSDMTSRSEKRGTTPLRGKFPRSLTKSLEKSLHIIHHTFNCQLCFLHFSLSQVVFGTLPVWNPCQPFSPASRMPQRVRQATGKFSCQRDPPAATLPATARKAVKAKETPAVLMSLARVGAEGFEPPTLCL